MSDIKIREIDNQTDKMLFIKFPWKIYKGNPNWVPPLIFDVRNNLDPKKNPFFDHAEVKYFLAYKDDRIAGRIAGIINDNHNKFYNDKTGFWGFFECIDDVETAGKLFAAVNAFLKDKGMDLMRGPVNPSTNDEIGLLVNAFDKPPVALMTYNPEYYINLVESNGHVKAKNLFAYLVSKDTIAVNRKAMDKLKRISDMVLKKENIKIRKINMKDFENELLRVMEVYNKAWEDNWGFVPMTDDEFKHIAKMFKAIIDKDLVFFAEAGGKPVGFSLAFPDVNQALIKLNGRLFPFGIFKFLSAKKKINIMRMLTMGVITEYQRKGIDAVFVQNTIDEGLAKGYFGAEISWILEDNIPMVRTAVNLGADKYKTYRIYDKKIV
ncbi:MAG: hypothetical protein NTV87_05080 [Ignavibacteriae bacterium]|nr:hypothetical protein [Ignavibacteriota bacterium]